MGNGYAGIRLNLSNRDHTSCNPSKAKQPSNDRLNSSRPSDSSELNSEADLSTQRRITRQLARQQQVLSLRRSERLRSASANARLNNHNSTSLPSDRQSNLRRSARLMNNTRGSSQSIRASRHSGLNQSSSLVGGSTRNGHHHGTENQASGGAFGSQILRRSLRLRSVSTGLRSSS